MRILLAAIALLVATHAAPVFAKGGGAKKGAAAAAADPDAVVVKAHGGKLWILTSAPPSSEGEELSKWLSSHPTVTEVTKKPSEERWRIVYLAVFKRPPAKGPLTFNFVDKKEPRTLVAQDTSQSPAGSLVFQEPYDLQANDGFNKGHTYIMRVGQIIKNRFVSYVTAEITLK